MLSRLLESVFRVLRSFFVRTDKIVSPLDALYHQLERDSDLLVASKIEEFRQTASHES